MGEREDIEFLRAVYADWSRGDFSRAEVFAPDVEFVTDFPDKGVYRGPEGVAKGFRGFLSAWTDFSTTAEEIVPTGGGRYLVLERLRGSGKESGVPIDSPAANLITVRDGKIVRLQLFSHRDEARAAAGLG
jgi:ketosteroid isomerase-like protein